MQHPVEHLRFPKAAVETVAEFRQVAGQMLLADAVMDTTDIAFDIGDQGMDPGQDLHCLFSRTGHQPLMTGGRVIQGILDLTENRNTVVVVDSAGAERTARVCEAIGYRKAK